MDYICNCLSYTPFFFLQQLESRQNYFGWEQTTKNETTTYRKWPSQRERYCTCSARRPHTVENVKTRRLASSSERE